MKMVKKNSRGFAGIVVVLILATLVVLAGFSYSLGAKKINTKINIATPTSSSLPIVSQAPNSDLANWKTYTNNQVGFELKYPSDWTNSNENKNAYPQVTTLVKTLDSAFYNPDLKHVLWIKLVNNPTNNSLEQVIKSGVLDKDYGTLSTIFDASDTNIPPKFSVSIMNGYQIYQPDDNWPSAFGIKTVFVKNPINNSFAWINLEPYDTNNLKPIFDQILSTFKFTK